MMQEFVEQINKTIRKHIRGIHTAMPGIITDFDTATGLATVLPKMKYKLPNGSTIDYPQITGVPVLFQQGWNGQATVAFPVKAGDGCLVIIAEQSIDYWMYGQETPTDLAFDMSNAICIPGLFVKANEVIKEACERNAAIIDVKGTRLTLTKDEMQIDAPILRINGDIIHEGALLDINS